MKRGLKILALTLLIANLFFVSAAHTITPTSFTKDVYVSSYTITIENTDTYTVPDTGANTNVTNVSIILPSGFTFISETNSTSSLSIFSSSSNVLSWYNISSGGYVIGSTTGGDNSKTFSFNLNATTLGTFNVTVRTTNATGNFDFGISLRVNDTSSPSVTLNSPANNDEDVDGVLVFDCNATDNYDLDSIALYIWDNSSSEVYKSILATSGLSNQTDFDYTFSSDGTYKWNCFANDTAKNFNWASNRTIKISAGLTSCTPDWDCNESDWSPCADGLQTRTCNDLNSCANNATKPDESQVCVSACAPEWDCTDWAPLECPESEQQTRTCNDVNECNSTAGKLPETRVCTFEKSSSGMIIVSSIIALMIIGGGIAAFFYMKNKNPSVPSSQPLTSYTGNSGNASGSNSQGYTYKYS